MARPSRDWRRWGRLVVRPTRERLGLTREQLARTATITVNSIARLELGRTRRPNLRVLRSLCNALDLPLPGDEGLYLSLDGVTAEKLRRLVAAALYEFARRRRDAARFATLIHLPSDATQLRLATETVTAERDLAIDVWGALCPELDETVLTRPPQQSPRPRRTAMQPRPPHRIPRHVERTHG
jgi:transcriptional regulator with XRE-family HTH domain